MNGPEARDHHDRATISWAIHQTIATRLSQASANTHHEWESDWANGRVADKPWWYFGLRTEVVIRIGDRISSVALGLTDEGTTQIEFYVGRHGRLYLEKFIIINGIMCRVAMKPYSLRHFTPRQLSLILDTLKAESSPSLYQLNF